MKFLDKIKLLEKIVSDEETIEPEIITLDELNK